MKRLLTTGGILCCAVAAFAVGSFLTVASNTYKFSKDSPAAKAKCMLCHTSMMGGANKLNPYGLDLKAALKGSMKMTPQILHSIDNLKSGKHAETNGQLLSKGQLPG